jgi:hypothetical protein
MAVKNHDSLTFALPRDVDSVKPNHTRYLIINNLVISSKYRPIGAPVAVIPLGPMLIIPMVEVGQYHAYTKCSFDYLLWDNDRRDAVSYGQIDGRIQIGDIFDRKNSIRNRNVRILEVLLRNISIR